jgi:hypothetical protein
MSTLRPVPGKPHLLHEIDECVTCGRAVSWQQGDPIAQMCACGAPLIFEQGAVNMPVGPQEPEEV